MKNLTRLSNEPLPHVMAYEMIQSIKENKQLKRTVMKFAHNKCISDYKDNFIKSEENSNQFIRYKEKTRKNILVFLKEYFPFVFTPDEELREKLPFEVDSFEDFICYMCWTGINDGWDLMDFLHDYEVDDDGDMEETGNREMQKYMLSIKNRKYNSLNEIIDMEFSSALKKHVTRCIVADPTIEEGNYVRRTAPNTVLDILQILDDTVNWVYIDLQRMFRSSFREGLIQQGKEFLLDGMKKEVDQKLSQAAMQIEELEKENEELKKQLARKEEELKTAGREEAEKTLDIMTEEQVDLARTNHKLKTRYNNLFGKYQKLKGEEEEEKEFAKEEQLIMEVDKTARYTFLAHENSAFQSNLLKEFPNARFITGNADLSADGTDAVIVISRHISHPVYYGIKAQCKAKKIPFLHTPSTNVELITEVLSNYYNNL